LTDAAEYNVATSSSRPPLGAAESPTLVKGSIYGANGSLGDVNLTKLSNGIPFNVFPFPKVQFSVSEIMEPEIEGENELFAVNRLGGSDGGRGGGEIVGGGGISNNDRSVNADTGESTTPALSTSASTKTLDILVARRRGSTHCLILEFPEAVHMRLSSNTTSLFTPSDEATERSLVS
jgi:hypothetical protein